MINRTNNEIIREVLKNYLTEIKSRASIPQPEEIEKELINRFSEEFDLENSLLPRGRKLSAPNKLSNAMISEILLALYDIKLIMWADSEDDKNCDVAIYCDKGRNEGLYIFDESVFYQTIKRFNYNIETRDVKEIKQMLFNMAPKCRRNNNPDLIAVNNGIFNYKTKELLPFSADYVFTTKSRVDYNPNAKNITIHNDKDNTDWDVVSWVASLSDNPQIVLLLWEIIGAVIRPNVSWNRLACFFSTVGNNGKGTFCKLLRNICGENNCAAIPLEKFSQEFMLEPLSHISAVITDENSTKSFIKESDALKAAVTGDEIFVNRKFKNPISLKYKGMIVQCINALPKFSDKTESLYRRLLIIPFSKCFKNIERKYIKDDYLNRKEVLEYVLYEVLNSNYYEFDIPLECENMLAEYKQFNDPVRDFLDTFLDVFVWDLVPFGFLYDLFKAWSKEVCPSGTIIGKNMFIEEVKSLLDDNNDWIVKTTGYPTGNLMDASEMLIAEYNLIKWANKCYTGNDIARRCQPSLSTSYKGILRVKNARRSYKAVS